MVEPDEPDDLFTKGVVNPLDILNLFSPSAWINGAIAELTGFDVFEWMADVISGDWAALYKFGDAMGNLGQCLQQLGLNVTQGAADVDPHWDGNAADAAYVYFCRLGGAVSGHEQPLDDVRARYQNAAKGAYLLADELGNIFQVIADRAIIGGIAAAGGTALAETGAGAIVGYGPMPRRLS